MVDLRIQHTDPNAGRAAPISGEGAGSGGQHTEDAPHQHETGAGAEELAVALAASDRGDALSARYEVSAEGAPLVRIVDRVRNETVALVTPEELKALAEDTGLPPGLLLRVSS